MKTSQSSARLRTAAVHAGEGRDASHGSIAMPLYQSSTYELGEDLEFDDIRYVRLNNTPNQQAVSRKLAALESCEAGLVTPSGAAAVSMALLAHLERGDHVIAQEGVYGGTRKLLDSLEATHGIRVTYVAGDDVEAWEQARTEKTRVLYVESLTNPCLDIAALDEAVVFARRHRLVSIIDNTFPTPINLRPAELGFDVVVHSASKSLNGHSDVVAGAIVGAQGPIERVRRFMNRMGVCLDPRACYLLMRGLKTLPLRMQAQNANGLALAKHLSLREDVERVRYPGLEGDPAYPAARRWFSGFGGVVTFTPKGGLARAQAILEKLRLPRIAPSLGGVETLICRPANTSHAGLPAATRESLGVTDAMLRVSLGIEAIEDLIEDFDQALAT